VRRIEEAKVKVAGEIVVEIGGVLEWIEWSGYGTLDYTISVEASVEIASGNLGERCHSRDVGR
jgi:hypothetical protein